MKKLAIFIVFFVCFSHVALAKNIHVKYRGVVDVENGQFVSYKLKPSSLVQEIYFDASNRYLIVNLNGTNYHYCGIEKNVVETWVSSESLGRFYNYNIKGNFDCRKNPMPNY